MSKKTDRMTADDIYNKYNDHPLRGQPHKDCSRYNAFYEGHHYGDSPPRDDRITSALETESFMHRSKLNNILPNAHIAVSNLLKESPTLLGVPTGTDLKDKLAARVVTDLVTNIFDQNERNLLSDVFGGTLNSYKYGLGYVYPYWDDNNYAVVTKGGFSKRAGDWETSVHDIFEIFHDPAATKFSQLKWMHRAFMADINDLRDAYPKIADQISESVTDEITASRYSYSPEEEYTASEATKNRALVLEYWERPSKKYSKGRKVVVINKTILAKEDDNPDADLGYLYSLPFIPFFWNKSPEKFRGLGGIKDQIPIQKEINFVASNIMKNIRLTSGMSYLVPKGAGIKEQQLTGEPQIIYYNAQGGMPPTVVGGTPQASYVLQYLNFLISMQGDVAGIHEVSKAQLPPRGSHMPAALYKQLQDTEAVRFAHNMRNLQVSMKLLTMRILKLIQKHWDQRRYFNILGEDRGYEMKAFEKSQLEGSWDVTMKVVSAINSSPAAKIETAMNLADRGVLQAAEEGQEWAIKFLETIEYGDMKPFIAKRKMQLTKANWFMETLINKRKVPTILEIYDEKVFLETLHEFMLTKQYEDMDDETQFVFEDAVKLLNENMVAKEQRKAQMRQPQQQQLPPQAAPADVMQQVEGMGEGGGIPAEGMPVEGGMIPEGM